MKIKSLIVAAGAALFPWVAQAGVIYQWQATNNATPWGVKLELEFDQQTVDSGSFAFDYHQSPEPGHAPRTGLLRIQYSNWSEPVWPLIYSAADDGFFTVDSAIRMQVAFTPAGLLTGSIYVNDTFQHFQIVSTGNQFTFVDANSDGPMDNAGCPGNFPCIGATGLLQRQPREVPEPASLALLGIGALAVAGALRRRTARICT